MPYVSPFVNPSTGASVPGVSGGKAVTSYFDLNLNDLGTATNGAWPGKEGGWAQEKQKRVRRR